MESDLGKLFVGGISWDTNEDRLREYFENFGEVVEAVIMKDRTTGRKRGFGFVVFADPAVAERVLLEKHQIDGRMVEAKKAIPRDDQHILLNRNNSSLPGSPVPSRTKKIFVGGLASTVTEAEFRKYFEQFGTITDVVVMYDHNTQRPRGFGFITFDSEDTVDKVLHKTFHELNGKMVEVKRAVPKEQSPGPSMRLPVGRHNYGLNSFNNFHNGYSQGYTPSSISSYGMRMDGRFGPLMGGRKGLPSFGTGYGIGMNFEPGVRPSYGENLNLSTRRTVRPFYSENAARFTSPIGYGAGSGNLALSVGSASRTIWDNGVLDFNTNPARANSFSTSGIGNIAGSGNDSINWLGLSSPLVGHATGGSSDFTTGNLGYGTGDNILGLFSGGYGRSNDIGSLNTSFTTTRNIYEGSYSDSYGGSSIYGDPTWHSATNELDGLSSFRYGLGATTSNVISKGSIDYISGYDDITNKQIIREE
ncbi:heterogeneous nuclear ribonucleoprotein 1-like [Phalaenopsis equestris]|uniref:heterogeneous nuclear ribonucleoprotein 1-like n=1 Tax=Phalaenopsis equestris TaxID=78828 RepID=UPI0009E47098|nr:heterogeneous nuclear ribonucleoprotein 1-like [Phalaenopsis equestris]XP_020574528.1 heterogeneous nuclear ribonucleoprotein 1-like [Phalaenopsis equestris]